MPQRHRSHRHRPRRHTNFSDTTAVKARKSRSGATKDHTDVYTTVSGELSAE